MAAWSWPHIGIMGQPIAPAAGEAIEQRSGMSDDPARHGDSASSTPRPASEEPAVGHGGVSAARPG